MGPALQIPIDQYFIGDFWGFLLALPISLFLAFWMSAVKSSIIVVVGALIGTILGFLIILGWVGTLIFSTPLPNSNGVSTFFGALFLCSILGLVGGMALDLLVARFNRQDYRRQPVVE